MLAASKFSTQAMAFHCFTSDFSFVPASVLSVIVAKIRNSFDGAIATIPIPSDAAPEIPRIILKSANDKRELQAGPERISVIYKQLPTEQPGHVDVDEALKAALKVFSTARKGLRFRVSRIAAIQTRTLTIPDPAMELARHFCKREFLDRASEPKGALSRSENFELHAHKKFQPQKVDVDINSWMRCKTGSLISTGVSQPAVVVEQDMNTLQDLAPTASFDDIRMRSILRRLITELDAVLQLYFPEVPE